MINRTPTNTATWFVLIACIVLFAGCHSKPLTSSAPGADGWRTVAASDGSFSFSVPGDPEKRVEHEDAELGPVTHTFYTLKHEKVYFFVVGTECPEGKLTPPGAEKFLHGAIEGMRQTPGVTFLSEKTVELNGSPGRDVVMNIEKKTPARMYQRWFIVKNRILALSVAYPQAQDSSAEAARFLDSLKVN
ncbi:MAG: hypothetical protein JWL77_6221 [Chthonomonadaceae bacterium]|nr:hypothetical protein [Chthonomonadaceae bacterium]